jgi:hypothetical protein
MAFATTAMAFAALAAAAALATAVRRGEDLLWRRRRCFVVYISSTSRPLRTVLDVSSE